MKNKLFQGDYIVALLRSTEKQVIEFALNQMRNNMAHRWIHYVDSIDLLKDKYNQLDWARPLIANVLSQIFFYSSQLDEAVEWSLQSEGKFDVKERSLYHDSILTIIVDTYIGAQGKENQISQQKLEACKKVVVEMMDCSFAMKRDCDQKMLIGLALEMEKFQYVEHYLQALPEGEFQKAFNQVSEIIAAHEHKEQIYKIFLNELLKHQNKDHQLITNCYMNLNKPKEHAQVLYQLLQQDKESCYQLLVDIEETGNLGYVREIEEELVRLSPEDKEKLSKLLQGGLRAEIDLLFLTQNNNVDGIFLKELAKKWNPSDSISSNSFSLFFSFALQGTSDISVLKDDKILSKYEKVSNWALFSTVGSLGLIHKHSDRLPLLIKELKVNEGSDYAQGGLLFAQGLSNFGKPLEDERKHTLIQNLKSGSLKEGVKHGSALLLGSSYALSNDQKLADELQQYLYGEKSNVAEACGYALGLIKATNFEMDIVENLINASRNNNHDRIARSVMIALGLMALGNRKKVFLTFERLIKEQDSVLRFGAVQMLGMAFMNTADNEVLNILLQIAATDLSNDVRRSAVLGITFVLLSSRNKAITLLTMLSNSYNEYVRHAVALSLGILGAHKYDSKINSLLKTLWADKTFHVKQAVGIAWGMICQLGTEQTCQFMNEVRGEMTQCLDNKYETSSTKLGVYFGFGLMQSGGGNSQLSLITKQGYLKLKNIIGMYLFTHYWYWFPLSNFLGISHEPSYLVGVTASLQVPRGFKFQSKAPKSYFDYFKTKVEEKVDKEKTVVQLSVTNKLISKGKKGEKKGKVEVKKEEQLEEKMEIEKKPEPNFTILDNPSRVVEKQEMVISYTSENKRYEVIQPSRHIGIVFLKDLQPDQPEVYMNDLPKEKHLIPPQDFVFNEEMNK